MIKIRKEGDRYVERLVIIPDHNCSRNVWLTGNARAGRIYEAQPGITENEIQALQEEVYSLRCLLLSPGIMPCFYDLDHLGKSVAK